MTNQPTDCQEAAEVLEALKGAGFEVRLRDGQLSLRRREHTANPGLARLLRWAELEAGNLREALEAAR